MEHKSIVNISSVGASYKTKINKLSEAKVSTIVGNGYASSSDLSSLQNMSKDLTGCVDRNNERVYKLLRD